MKRFLQFIGGALLCAASFALLGGCNTMEGAGEDVEAGGETVQDAANGNP